jgi:hypothetical protein
MRQRLFGALYRKRRLGRKPSRNRIVQDELPNGPASSIRFGRFEDLRVLEVSTIATIHVATYLEPLANARLESDAITRKYGLWSVLGFSTASMQSPPLK